MTSSSLLELRATDIVHSTVGTSEESLTKGFTEARRIANHSGNSCFLFMDEFQSMFGNRNSSISSQLIMLMDEEYEIRKQTLNISFQSTKNTLQNPFNTSSTSSISSSSSSSSFSKKKNQVSTITGQVIVIGATNLPQNIDLSFLRQGRFDRVLYCPPPDAKNRKRVLLQHAVVLPWYCDNNKKIKNNDNDTNEEDSDDIQKDSHNNNHKASLFSDFRNRAISPHLGELVIKTEGFSVADLGHLSRCALYHGKIRVRKEKNQAEVNTEKIRQDQSNNDDDDECNDCNIKVQACDYDNAFLEVQPSVTKEDLLLFENWKPPRN